MKRMKSGEEDLEACKKRKKIGTTINDIPSEVLQHIFGFIGPFWMVAYCVSKLWRDVALSHYKDIKARHKIAGIRMEPLAAEFFRNIRCDDRKRLVSLRQMESLCGWLYEYTYYSIPPTRIDAVFILGAIVGRNPMAIRWISMRKLFVQEKVMMKAALRSADLPTYMETHYLLRKDPINDKLSFKKACEIASAGNVDLFGEIVAKGWFKASMTAYGKREFFAASVRSGNEKMLDFPMFQDEFFRTDPTVMQCINPQSMCETDNVEMLKRIFLLTFTNDRTSEWILLCMKLVREHLPLDSSRRRYQNAGRTLIRTTRILEHVMEDLFPMMRGRSSFPPSLMIDGWNGYFQTVASSFIEKRYLGGCEYMFEKWWLPLMMENKQRWEEERKGEEEDADKTNWTFARISASYASVFKHVVQDQDFTEKTSPWSMNEWIRAKQEEYPLFVLVYHDEDPSSGDDILEVALNDVFAFPDSGMVPRDKLHTINEMTAANYQSPARFVEYFMHMLHGEGSTDHGG